MTISYNLPTQTVALDITPEEVTSLTDAGRTRIKELFAELIAHLKGQLASIGAKP